MKNSPLRKLIRKVLQEQTIQYAHPMDLDSLLNMFKPHLQQGEGLEAKNIFRRFRGALKHIFTGEHNPNCGCGSHAPGGDGI